MYFICTPCLALLVRNDYDSLFLASSDFIDNLPMPGNSYYSVILTIPAYRAFLQYSPVGATFQT